LTAGLSNARNIVGDRRSALNTNFINETKIPLYLDLEAYNVAHCETECASNGHRNPELRGVEEGEVGKGAELASNDHEGNEDQTCVDVVVISQLPDIVVNLKIEAIYNHFF